MDQAMEYQAVDKAAQADAEARIARKAREDKPAEGDIAGRPLKALRKRLYRRGVCWSCASPAWLYGICLWVSGEHHAVCAKCSREAPGWGLNNPEHCNGF
jgi:hypothetical protein